MSLRKPLQPTMALSPGTPQQNKKKKNDSAIDDDEPLSTSNTDHDHPQQQHQQQTPPFLTLEETTTAADTTSMLQHSELMVSDDRAAAARKRALQSTHNANHQPPLSTTTGEEEQQHQQQQLNQNHQMGDDEGDEKKDKSRKMLSAANLRKTRSLCSGAGGGISFKTMLSYAMFALIFVVLWDGLLTPPEKRWIQPSHTQIYIEWVEHHPIQGLFAITIVIAAAVVVLIPIGTPLTLGCGFIYTGAYGWKLGLALATLISMGGSALGAVICFLLGRYLLREQVRHWARNKYPLFDAIDVAAAEHGLRIMAMLYLTPILPLGPVSYMCGTTSMALSSFVIAKIASLPLMLLYCFIGASMRSLISGPKQNNKDTSAALSSEMKKVEENKVLIALGILLSLVMITGITTYIRKELHKILERQEKHKPGEKSTKPFNNLNRGNPNSTDGGANHTTNNNTTNSNNNHSIEDDDAIEMGISSRSTARRRAA